MILTLARLRAAALRALLAGRTHLTRVRKQQQGSGYCSGYCILLVHPQAPFQTNLQGGTAGLPPTSLLSIRGCLLCVCTAEETTSLASVTPEPRKQHARTKQTGGVRRALIQVYREIFIPELQDAKYPTGLFRTRESLQDPPPWPLVSLIHRLLEA